jgi:hypothetical protein
MLLGVRETKFKLGTVKQGCAIACVPAASKRANKNR